MRFEELLAHQGPLVHVDHSFRRPRQRSAPTEAAESTNFLSQLQKPDLDKTEAEWVDLVGREDGSGNSNARLWDVRVKYETLEPAARYGTVGKPETPQYATDGEKMALMEKLQALPSDKATIDKLETFLRYLRWLRWNTYNWKPWGKRTDLENAEERSWAALEKLFTAAVAMLNARSATAKAKKAVEDKQVLINQKTETIRTKQDRIAVVQEEIRKVTGEPEYRATEEEYKTTFQQLRKAKARKGRNELRKDEAKRDYDEAKNQEKDSTTRFKSAESRFKLLDAPHQKLVQESVDLKNSNEDLEARRKTLHKDKARLVDARDKAEAAEAGKEQEWMDMRQRFSVGTTDEA